VFSGVRCECGVARFQYQIPNPTALSFLPFPPKTYRYTDTYTRRELREPEMASVAVEAEAERTLNLQPPKIKLKARRLKGHGDSVNCCIASSQNPRIIVTSGEVTSIIS